MPNHVKNEVIIIGTPEQVAAVKEFVTPSFDFQKIIPRPASLDITSGTHLSDEEKALAASNIILYGYKDWYDWSCANWGTKWNSYSHQEIGENGMSFETAWSHPLPILKALSLRFPEVEFQIRFADEDTGHNVGQYILQDGEIIEDNSPQGGSKEAIRLAMDIDGDDISYMVDRITDDSEDIDEGLNDGNDYYEVMMEIVCDAEAVDKDFSEVQIQWALQYVVDQEKWEYAEKLKGLLLKKV